MTGIISISEIYNQRMGVCRLTQMPSIFQSSMHSRTTLLMTFYAVHPALHCSNTLDTDENGTILDQDGQEVQQQPENTEARFESLSRETTPKPKEPRDVNGKSPADDGSRKRTRSQTNTQATP